MDYKFRHSQAGDSEHEGEDVEVLPAAETELNRHTDSVMILDPGQPMVPTVQGSWVVQNLPLFAIAYLFYQIRNGAFDGRWNTDST